MIKKISIFFVALLFQGIFNISFAQRDTLKYAVDLISTTATGAYAPFWFQNQDYDLVSFNPNSIGLLAGVYKDFSHRYRHFDYAAKVNGMIRADEKDTKAYLHEYYIQSRFYFIDLIAGAREEHLGSQDSTLSCGGFLFSENARPMPKITAGIEHFRAIPYTRGYVEIKGALSHGWFTDNVYSTGVMLHHKYVYLRFGGKLPVRFQYGFEHVVQWGGYIPGLGQQPEGFSDYLKLFLGKSGGSNASLSDQINALGNSIGSQSVRLDGNIGNFEIGAYWQNIFEDSPVRLIGFGMNTPDGLWGISVRNRKLKYISGLLYEYLNTTDQSGPFHDLDGIVYGGADGYFKGQQYGFGWSYYGRTIGTPFITSPVYNQDGKPGSQNTRVRVHHFGAEGEAARFKYRMLLSFTQNFDTQDQMKPSTDLLLNINRTFTGLANTNIGLSFALDRGSMYGHNTGFMLTLSKRGVICPAR
jgi:hypothetical protein